MIHGVFENTLGLFGITLGLFGITLGVFKILFAREIMCVWFFSYFLYRGCGGKFPLSFLLFFVMTLFFWKIMHYFDYYS